MWEKIKAFGPVKIAGSILTAVLLVLAGAKAGREKRRAEKAEKKVESLHFEGSKKSIEKAVELQKQVDSHKEKAELVKQGMEAKLEELGSKDETLADVADRFNARRVRKRPGGAS
jgi:hypothetical protein